MYQYGALARFDLRVGTTQAGCLRLRDLLVPPPDQVLYSAYAVSYTRGDNKRVGDGFPSADWIWDQVHIAQLATLFGILFGNVLTTTYADAYIWTDVRTGDYATPMFVLFSCTALRPELNGPDGTPTARSPLAVATVHLRFVNLVAVS
jgi:hypothetical protein